MLPENIERKALESLSLIENGDVHGKDIELLLIWLREYSENNSIFREIAHFIAHSKRDSGQTFTSLYRLYCRWRAYSLYQYKKQELNLAEDIEKWFYDFVLFQINDIDSRKLKKSYGFSRKRAKQIFKSSFAEEKGLYKCRNPHDQTLIAILNEAFSFIKITSLYEQEEIIESFINTLSSLSLIESTVKIEKQSKKILLCLLVLMNKRTFHIGKNVFGHTTLTVPNNGFGELETLELRGTIQVPDMPSIVISLIKTDLSTNEWVSPELLTQKETNLKGHFWTVFDEDAHIIASDIQGKYVLIKH